MRTRLTLRTPTGDSYDVQVTTAAPTALADLRGPLLDTLGQSAGGQDQQWWAGSRALPASAILGGPGLRDGGLVYLRRPGPRCVARHAALRLDIVGGPDAGACVPLPRGVLTLGRADHCDVRFTDPDVSRDHAELTVTHAGISLRDLGSTNGTLIVSDDGGDDRALDHDGATLPAGRYVRLGDSVIRVAAADVPAAATSMSQDGRILVNRPPRLAATLPGGEVTYPEPNTGPESVGVPWVAALAPAAVGVGLAWAMHNPQFLAFALLSPVMMLASGFSDRFAGRRRRRRDRRGRRARHAAASAQLRLLLEHETVLRRRAHPDPAALARTALGPDARVWERRRVDPDFLDVRVGLGEREGDIRVHRSGQTVSRPRLRMVPMSIDLRTGPVGLCGPHSRVVGLARWAAAQIAVLHSPADLRIAALLSDADAEVWRWLRWLPHLQPAPEWIAHTDDRRQRLTADLVRTLDERLTRSVRTPLDRWSGDWIVLVVDRASRLAQLPGLARLLREGAAVGMTALCVDDEQRRLPPACVAVIRVSGETGSRVSVRRTDGVVATQRTTDDAVADRVPASWADQVARALAPLADPGAAAAEAIPSTARLLDLLRLDEPSPAELSVRWAAAQRVATVLGVDAEGPVSIDLSRDGPHALIAGTTGSGKSELLQSLIAGLAASCGPDLVQFVLIDYKGGAAFADCADLPHTAGVVTDLDAHLTERALRSLDAELRRRETLFGQAGVADIDAYRATTVRHHDPLGRLIIVVDEFAALAEELPDFVSGLVSIAQRGRSLGVHLVLATQRPGGVVSPEIRANTGLRVALRVTDEAESSDVLGSSVAAGISKDRPGRAFLRTGGTVREVQLGRIGSQHDRASSELAVCRLDRWGARTGERATPEPTGTKTDLRLLVDAAREAAVRAGLRVARRPWLPPLPDIVDTATIDPGVGPDVIALGLSDRPDEQQQVAFTIDLAHGGSLLMTGSARSGRTTALRTVAATAVAGHGPAALHLYALDCAGGALRPLRELPHCGALVGRDDPEAIDRVLGRLGAEVAHRQAVLAELGAGGVDEAAAAGHPLPWLLLLVDGWEGFCAAAETVDAGRPMDTLLHLIREAPSVALTVVVTGDRGALSGRLSGTVQNRLVLRLSDPADYAMAGIARRSVPEQMPPGRGVCPGDGTEVQLGVVGGDASVRAQNAVTAALASRWRAEADGLPRSLRPLRVRALPARVRLSELAPGGRSGWFILGAGGDDAAAVGVDLAGTGARLLVAGPPRSGRSGVLTLLARQAARRRVHTVVAAPPRAGLTAVALELGLPVLSPDGEVPGGDDYLGPLLLLVDDSEAFLDTAVGDGLATLVRRSGDELSAVVAGRSDDLALCFRGIAAEIKRSRTGLLLCPGPGDGELVGLRLPMVRASPLPGRGVLVADTLRRGDGDQMSDRAAVPIQVALHQ